LPALACGELIAGVAEAAFVLASVHEAEPSSPLLDVHANVACERERARAVLDAARRRLADPDAAELVLVPASSTPRSLHLLAEERGASALVLGRSHRLGFARSVLPGGATPLRRPVPDGGGGEEPVPRSGRVAVAYDDTPQGRPGSTGRSTSCCAARRRSRSGT
jgi:hypothetical protein